MSFESLRFPEQFDRDVTEVDLRNDPDYIRWSAELEAQSDVENRIAMKDGLARLRDRGASLDEIEAYMCAFNTALTVILHNGLWRHI